MWNEARLQSMTCIKSSLLQEILKIHSAGRSQGWHLAESNDNDIQKSWIPALCPSMCVNSWTDAMSINEQYTNSNQRPAQDGALPCRWWNICSMSPRRYQVPYANASSHQQLGARKGFGMRNAMVMVKGDVKTLSWQSVIAQRSHELTNQAKPYNI